MDNKKSANILIIAGVLGLLILVGSILSIPEIKYTFNHSSKRTINHISNMKIGNCDGDKSDDYCVKNKLDCIIEIHSNNCALFKKKSSEEEVIAQNNKSRKLFNKAYCFSILEKVKFWVKKANSYEQDGDEDRHTSKCVSRLTMDLRAINSLQNSISSIEDNNLWKIGSSHLYMRAALVYAMDCLSCTDQKFNRTSCSDMREEINEINCNIP